MQCFKCGGEMAEVCRDYNWQDAYAGQVQVPNLSYKCCANCGETLFDPAAFERIEEVCEKKLHDWLENRPIKDFWDSQQVTECLGVSRQALNKNFRYRKLLYKLDRNGKYSYLVESVLKFKRTGDGRIPIEMQAATNYEGAKVALAWEVPSIKGEFRVGAPMTSSFPYMKTEVA